jgi:hypothetical protein
MSTNTTTLHQGSAHSARGALAAPLAVAAILLAFAGLVALNADLRPAVVVPAPVSDAQVQKVLIDVRAGERDSHSIGSDASIQRALIDVRAGERDSVSIGSDAQVQRALIDFRAGERDSRAGAVPTAGWIEFRAGH